MRLKTRGPATIAELAADLGLSGEAIRQQLAPLERELWIEREALPPSGEPGRPPGRYRLTLKGEGLFPKRTGLLAVAFADAIREEMGEEALEQILARVTDARVLDLQGSRGDAAGPMSEKVARTRGIYGADDAFVDLEKVPDGYRLIERNCPFLDVALARPVLCSSTVTTLTRVLGCRVVREERFQDGHGCCSFRIYEDQPVDVSGLRFEREPDHKKPSS
jgi:predicted ArsR family transcriptional regulator